MESKNDFRSKGPSHLQSELSSPFVPEHWFRTEFKRGSEKGPFEVFKGLPNLAPITSYTPNMAGCRGLYNYVCSQIAQLL